MKQALKYITSQIPLLSICKGNRFIFCYHDISKEKEEHHSPLYSTTIEQFVGQIKFLKKKFDFVTLDKIIDQDKLCSNKNYAAITFDDGFKSVIDNAWPILKENKIPITIFVNKRAIEEDRLWVTDYVSNSSTSKNHKEFIELLENYENCVNDYKSSYRKRVYLNKEELLHLKKEGVSIQNHTLSHPVLSKINEEQFSYEINENKNYIEEKLNCKVDHFAIPFGKREHFSSKVLNAIFKNHKYSYTTNPNKIRKENALFPRIVLTNETCTILKFYINRAIIKKIYL